MKILDLLVFAIGLTGLWFMDVGVGAWGGLLSNGFWEIDALKVYHIGLYATYISLVYLAVRKRHRN